MNSLSLYKQTSNLIPFLGKQAHLLPVIKNQQKQQFNLYNQHKMPSYRSYLPAIQQNTNLTFLNKYNIISTVELEKELPKMSKIRGFLKEFVLLVKEGTKEAYKDCKWLAKNYSIKSHKNFSGFELREEKRILVDLFKFVPFSAFIFIPGTEVLLPLYLVLFPNSVPTWYIFDHKWDAKIENLEEKQKDAHGILIHKLRDFLESKGFSPEDFGKQTKYKSSFMKYRKDIDKKLAIKNFSSDDLMEVAKFLGIDYMSGTYIMSTLLRFILNTPRYIVNLGFIMARSKKRWEHQHWIFNHTYKMNFGPFEFMKRAFLRFQINRHLRTLKKQDISFFKFGMHDIQGHQITNFARERGITTISCYETLKVFMQNDWVSMCMRFSNDQLIWYAMMQYDFLEHANKEFN